MKVSSELFVFVTQLRDIIMRSASAFVINASLDFPLGLIQASAGSL